MESERPRGKGGNRERGGPVDRHDLKNLGVLINNVHEPSRDNDRWRDPTDEETKIFRGALDELQKDSQRERDTNIGRVMLQKHREQETEREQQKEDRANEREDALKNGLRDHLASVFAKRSAIAKPKEIPQADMDRLHAEALLEESRRARQKRAPQSTREKKNPSRLASDMGEASRTGREAPEDFLENEAGRNLLIKPREANDSDTLAHENQPSNAIPQESSGSTGLDLSQKTSWWEHNSVWQRFQRSELATQLKVTTASIDALNRSITSEEQKEREIQATIVRHRVATEAIRTEAVQTMEIVPEKAARMRDTEIGKLTKDLEDVQARIVNFKKQRESYNTKRDGLQAKFEQLISRVKERIDQEIKPLQDAIDETQVDFENAKGKFEKYKQTREKIEAYIVELRQRIESVEFQSERITINSWIKDNTKRLRFYQEKIKVLEVHIKKAEQKINNSETNVGRLRGIVGEFEAAYEHAKNPETANPPQEQPRSQTPEQAPVVGEHPVQPDTQVTQEHPPLSLEAKRNVDAFVKEWNDRYRSTDPVDPNVFARILPTDHEPTLAEMTGALETHLMLRKKGLLSKMFSWLTQQTLHRRLEAMKKTITTHS